MLRPSLPQTTARASSRRWAASRTCPWRSRARPAGCAGGGEPRARASAAWFSVSEPPTSPASPQAARAHLQQTYNRVAHIAERRPAQPAASSSAPSAPAAPASGSMPRTPGLAPARARAAVQQHPLPLPLPGASLLLAAASSSSASAAEAPEPSLGSPSRPRWGRRPNPLAQAAPLAPAAPDLSESISGALAALGVDAPGPSSRAAGEPSGSRPERSPSVFVEAPPAGALRSQSPPPPLQPLQQQQVERGWEENALSPVAPPRPRARSPTPQLSPLLRAASTPISRQASQGETPPAAAVAAGWEAVGGGLADLTRTLSSPVNAGKERGRPRSPLGRLTNASEMR